MANDEAILKTLQSINDNIAKLAKGFGKDKTCLSKADIYFALPAAGGRLSLQAGTTEFNFYIGKINHPDGTTTDMPSSLRSTQFDWCQSLRIDTDTVSTFWLESSGGARTIEANDAVMLAYLEYTSVFIKCDTTFTVRVWASTAPEAVIVSTGAVSISSSSASGGRATTAPGDTVTVATTATLIVASNTQRKCIKMVNVSAGTVYTGQDATVTTANGLPMLQNVVHVDDIYTGDIYGIVAVGNSDVRYVEEV